MSKLNDTQLVLLSAASQREDHYLTLPSGARRARRGRPRTSCWPPDSSAKSARGRTLRFGAVRRRPQRAFALKLTAAGLKAIAADTEDSVDTPRREPIGDVGETALTMGGRQAVDGEQSPELDAPSASPVAPRNGTKIDDVVKMLSRPDGATIDAIVTATGWLPHTTRAALTGLRKRGYAIERSRSGEGGPSVYRLTRPSQPGV